MCTILFSIVYGKLFFNFPTKATESHYDIHMLTSLSSTKTLAAALAIAVKLLFL